MIHVPQRILYDTRSMCSTIHWLRVSQRSLQNHALRVSAPSLEYPTSSHLKTSFTYLLTYTGLHLQVIPSIFPGWLQINCFHHLVLQASLGRHWGLNTVHYGLHSLHVLATQIRTHLIKDINTNCKQFKLGWKAWLFRQACSWEVHLRT